MLKIVLPSAVFIYCLLSRDQVNCQANGAPSNDAFVHYLCALCTPYTSDVCCSILNKCCFSECPERTDLNCVRGRDSCYYGRCPNGKRCCPGNLYFCCVDSTVDGDDEDDVDQEEPPSSSTVAPSSSTTEEESQ